MNMNMRNIKIDEPKKGFTRCIDFLRHSLLNIQARTKHAKIKS